MPRRSGGGARSAPRAPSRPMVPAKAPAPPQQSRPTSTMAAPHAGAPPAAPVSQGPGLFAQMASTAAGVAIGSTIGHTVGNLLTGGSSAPAEQPAAAAQQTNDQQLQNNCAGAAQSFTKCMDEHGGNMQICNWYLEQLKACQQAAGQY